MKRIKTRYLRVKIWIWSHILKKDSMKHKIRLYRLYGVQIGDGVRAFSPIISAEPYLISIGNNVTISNDVKFITHDNCASKLWYRGGAFFGAIEVGDNCFIGANSIILPGVTLGENVIVGAGSVVTKSFKGGTVVAGNPAREICDIEVMRKKHKCHLIDASQFDNYPCKEDFVMSNMEKMIRK